RVGTPLDLVAGRLRDLDSLISFLAPLSPSDWMALDAQVDRMSAAPVPDLVGAASPSPTLETPHWLVDSRPSANRTKTARQPLRLRDCAPALAASRSSQAASSAGGWAALKLAVKAFLARRWVVVATAAVLLAMGTGLLTLAVRGQQSPRVPRPSHLLAIPSKLSLLCTGRGSARTLVLRDTGTTTERWVAQPLSDLRLSPVQGTLRAGADVTIHVTVVHARTSHGNLTFTDQDGTLTVPYTVACSE